MEDKIRWWVPQIGDQEGKYIKQVLDKSFPNEGELAALFEQKISGLLHCKHAVTVTSGTSALFLSLKALGVRASDEVIVPDVTFIATANAVEMCGAIPVLVDVDPRTLTMDPEAFKRAITDKTKAVIVVHVSGRATDMESIISIAENQNIAVIEDAAEAFMSKHKEKYLGTFGDAGCFSFSAHKTITTGQGGVVVTNSGDTHIRLLELKDHGRRVRGTGGDDVHNVVGYNFKFTDLQAAVGLGQLEYLNSRLERMKKTYCMYADILKNTVGISLFDFDINGGEIPQWTDAIVEDRDGLDQYLSSRNIDCRRYWHPVHTQKPYIQSDHNFPNSTRLSPMALWLPSAFTLSDADIQRVSGHMLEFMKKRRTI
ncbi:MAG: DegT/DnrJ/EryC1/StrS family aminotransferase [Nitrospirae bacterium]|nr:DegT/DnrJ/EryC1/StrS family aminotransferase [Nitrospirota bacterium]